MGGVFVKNKESLISLLWGMEKGDEQTEMTMGKAALGTHLELMILKLQGYTKILLSDFV